MAAELQLTVLPRRQLPPGLGVASADSHLLADQSAGASLVLQAVFELSKTLELLERYRVTHVYGSDSMLRAVLEAAAGDRRSFKSWRWGCHANFSRQPLELKTSHSSLLGSQLTSRSPGRKPRRDRSPATWVERSTSSA